MSIAKVQEKYHISLDSSSKDQLTDATVDRGTGVVFISGSTLGTDAFVRAYNGTGERATARYVAVSGQVLVIASDKAESTISLTFVTQFACARYPLLGRCS